MNEIPEPVPSAKIRKKRKTSQRILYPTKNHRIFALLLAAVGLSLSSCADIVVQEGRRLEKLVRELGTPGHAPKPVAHRDPLTHRDATGDFAACRHFFANGKPPVLAPRPSDRALCYDAFAILHSGASKTPVYVAERLNRATVADADEVRTNRFFADARLRPAERATLDDYKGSGFDRGHMAPAGDMPTAQAMAQSFSLANMVPQAPKHNQGAWRVSVEAATRKYAAKASGDVYVITGPVYLPSMAESPAIGPGNVRVPRYLFKLVYDEDRNRAWVHWHRNDNDMRASQPISYGELVRRTGIEFLPGMRLGG